ncbi:MAG: RHS repeat-associated core domain-containing protein [Deltaproteobacteria bacterium]|nr:RHS repeat-associated core domain-containing protein [Deltaproteobacteria bacterium]
MKVKTLRASLSNNFFTEFLGFEVVYQQNTNSTLEEKFTGQILDEETGLYYYNARYYSAEVGVFMAADSIVPDPYSSQSMNRYMYVLGNPVIYSDPSGHDAYTSAVIAQSAYWNGFRGGFGGLPPGYGLYGTVAGHYAYGYAHPQTTAAVRAYANIAGSDYSGVGYSDNGIAIASIDKDYQNNIEQYKNDYDALGKILNYSGLVVALYGLPDDVGIDAGCYNQISGAAKHWFKRMGGRNPDLFIGVQSGYQLDRILSSFKEGSISKLIIASHCWPGGAIVDPLNQNRSYFINKNRALNQSSGFVKKYDALKTGAQIYIMGCQGMFLAKELSRSNPGVYTTGKVTVGSIWTSVVTRSYYNGFELFGLRGALVKW